ncbi:hypothetical protein C8R46DRAFT_1213167 [Mycena filopes]|nr:hypothetical protein C8R46DRAFT_1213167 [Mycena filopes]
MSLAALLLGGLVAVAGWIEVKNLHEHPVDQSDANALYIHAAMFSILSLVGGFGLFGAISKKTGLVALFGWMLGFHLGFSIATGIYTIYTLFKRNPDEVLANCTNGSDDPTPIIVVTAYCVSWLFELYGYIIVSSYVKQLNEEESAKLVGGNPSAPMTHYVPPPNNYAFTQPAQVQSNQV